MEGQGIMTEFPISRNELLGLLPKETYYFMKCLLELSQDCVITRGSQFPVAGYLLPLSSLKKRRGDGFFIVIVYKFPGHCFTYVGPDYYRTAEEAKQVLETLTLHFGLFGCLAKYDVPFLRAKR